MGQEEQPAKQEGDSQERQRASPCEHCGSDTHEDVVKAAFWADRGWIAIEDIPARVCQNCVEQFYDAETARKILQLIAEPTGKPDRDLLVPVFSLADVELPERGGQAEVVDEEEIGAIQSVFTGMEPALEETEDSKQTEEAFLCKYCQSDTYEDVVRSALWTNRGLVAIEDIPARVCRQCKEQFYDEMTTWKIDQLIEHGFPREKASREISVPAFSLAQIS